MTLPSISNPSASAAGPSLVALPYDVHLGITIHFDLPTVTRIRSTCTTLANPALFPHLSAELHLNAAVAAANFSAFRTHLRASGLAVADPAMRDLDHVWRRRQVLQRCIWHLVATHNQASQTWWAALDVLLDRTRADLKSTHQLHDRRLHAPRMEMLDLTTELFLERAVRTALGRRHSNGLAGMSAFCQRNKVWINALDVSEAALGMLRQHDPSEPWAVDASLALVHMTWFGHRDGKGSLRACEFLAASGQPMVVLEGIGVLGRQLVPPGHPASPAIIHTFPELVAACWSRGHHALVYSLLDMYLVSHGSPVYQAHPLPTFTPPLAPRAADTWPPVAIAFPTSPQSASADVFQQLVPAGVSHAQFDLALLGLRAWAWDNTINWFRLAGPPPPWGHPTDPALLTWYLSRAPANLSLVHALCHDLPRRLRADVSDELVRVILAHVPFDPAVASVRPMPTLDADMDMHRNPCARCEQLLRLAGHLSATTRLVEFVGKRGSGGGMRAAAVPEPFMYSPGDARRRPVHGARAIRNLLASLPAHDPYTDPPRPASVCRRSPWRAYLAMFWAHGLPNLAFTLFWPYVRDTDPQAALNPVPFADFMWAVLMCGQFGEALKMLVEARAKGGKFETWRMTGQDWDEVEGDWQVEDDAQELERQAFDRYLWEHGLRE